MQSYSLIDYFFQYSHNVPPLVFSFLTFFIAYSAIIFFARYFGEAGLYSFIVIAIIAANIQVLKVSQFYFFDSPVALGTELFAAIFLATDILNEIYGKKAAQKGVFIGFAAMILWTSIVLLTLAFRPIDGDTVHESMKVLFTPAPILLIASFISYLISQLSDVSIFNALRTRTSGKRLWLRNNVSTLISALIDNSVFSALAFFILPRFVFSTEYVPIHTLIFTFILGTYVFRVFAAIIDTPFIYFAQKMLLRSNSLKLEK